MPLTLDATFAGPNSNSYQTQAAAQAIIDTIPNADAWTNAPATAGGPRDQALVRATSMLDVLGWMGVKVGSAESQALSWPRNFVPDPDYGSVDNQWIGWVGATVYLSSTVMPKRVLRAHVALALEVLRAGTADVWGVDDSANVAREKVGPLETDYVDRSVRRLGIRQYPQVWREVYPLLALSQPARVQRA